MICHHPKDYPHHFVAREWVCNRRDSSPRPHPILASTLEAARGALPPGLHRLDRDVRDDPVIVEVWI